MIYRSNGNNSGCLILIVVAIVMILLFRFTWAILFRTPLGIVLLVYIIYKYYKNTKKRKNQETTYYDQEDTKLNEEIEVDYEEYD